jgi:hypothetical protein
MNVHFGLILCFRLINVSTRRGNKLRMYNIIKAHITLQSSVQSFLSSAIGHAEKDLTFNQLRNLIFEQKPGCFFNHKI